MDIEAITFQKEIRTALRCGLISSVKKTIVYPKD